MRRLFFFVALAAVFSLALACGGGGGGSTVTPTPSATVSGSLTPSPSPTATPTPTPTPTPSPTPPPGQASYISGKVIGYPTGVALVGAIVSTPTGDRLATVGSDGTFSFAVEPGYREMMISALGYSIRDIARLVERGSSYDLGTIYLPAGTWGIGTVPAAGTTLGNEKVQIAFPAGSIPVDTQVLFSHIPENTLDIAIPGTFPDRTGVLGGINIKAAAALSGTVTVRITNALGLPVGFSVPIGYFNPATDAWEDHGIGTVSADGLWIEFTTTHFSTFLAALPVVSDIGSERDLYEVNVAGNNFLAGEPHVDIANGNLMIGVDLPGFNAYGVDHKLTFLYETDAIREKRMLELTAKGRPAEDAESMFGRIRFSALGQVFEAMVEDESEPTITKAFVDATIEDEDGNKVIRPSGIYPYTIAYAQYFAGKFASSASNSFKDPKAGTATAINSGPVAFGRTSSRYFPMHNRTGSQFGKGWYLAGMEKLLFSTDRKSVAVVGRGGDAPVVLSQGREWFVQNYSYLIDQSLGNLTMGTAYDEWKISNMVATDGEWLYYSNTFSPMWGVGTTYTYKLKDPLQTFENPDNEPGAGGEGQEDKYPMEPIAGTEIELVSTRSLSRPHGDPLAVNPVTHELYMLREGTIEKLSEGAWSVVVTLAQVGNTWLGAFKFAPNGDLYVLGGGKLYRHKHADGVFEEVMDASGAQALGVDNLGFFYVADFVGKITRGSIDGDGIVTTDVISGQDAKLPQNQEDPLPLLEASVENIFDIGFNSANEMFILTLDSLYRVDANGFISLLNSPKGRVELNHGRNTLSDSGWMEATYLAFAPNDFIYTSGLGRVGSKRIWYRSDGVWQSRNTESTTLTKENGKYIRTAPQGDKFTYDGDGDLLSVELPNGRKNEITYTGEGEEKKIATYSAMNGHAVWNFDHRGDRVEITDNTSRKTTFSFTGDQLARIETPGSVFSNYEYNDKGLLSKRTDNAGNYIEYEYGDNDEVTKVKYNGSYTQTITTEGLEGAVNEFADQATWPNLAPQVKEVSSSFSGEEEPTTSFKRKGLTVTVEQNGEELTKEYGEPGKLKKTTHPDGKVVEYFYNSTSGTLDKIVNTIRGDVWTFYYNDKGQIDNVINPLGEKKEYAYDEEGRLQSLYVNGDRYSFAYNEDGFPTDQTLNYSYTGIHADYNTLGQITKLTSHGNEVNYSYNIYGKVSQKQDGIDTVSLAYNTAGHMVEMTTTLTTYQFQVTGLHNCADIGGYMPSHIITGMNKPNGSAAFTYDQFYRATGIDSSDGVYTTTFQPNGLPTRFEFPGPDAIDFTYDDNGNVLTKQMPGRNISYQYNTDKQMTYASSPGVVVTFTYDEDGNKDRMTYSPQGGVQSCPNANTSFDISNDRLEGYTVNAGSGVYMNMVYGGFDMMLRYVNASGVSQASIGRNALGQITRIEGQNSSTYYTRNARGFVTRYNGPYNAATYTWNSRGCVNWSDSFGTHSVAMNNAGAITAVDHPDTFPGPDESYTYNSNGNRTYSHLRGATALAGDRPLYDAYYNYGWDTNRRLNAETPAVAGGKLRTYSWDAEGNLTGVTIYNGMDGESGIEKTISYTYSPFGLRTAKYVDGALVETYFYDHKENLIGLFDASGNLIAQYAHGDEGNRPLVMYASGTYYQFVQDGFRNVVAIVGGGNMQTFNYDAFGNIVGSSGPSLPAHFRFAGAEFDDDSGLYYMKHRWYHPQIGRFISPDPSLFKNGFNMYTYARNNPLRFFDPTGRWDEDDENDEFFFYPNSDVGVSGGSADLSSSGSYDLVDSTKSQIWLDDAADLTHDAVDAVVDQGIDKGLEAAGDWAVKKYGEKVVEFGMRNAPRAFSLGMKGAGRLVPIVGWALLAKDVLDVAAWGYGQYEYYRTKPW